ncbi:DUF937 domain-containing protein [Spirosoma flavum]|uniref:DUF937 domain-containing protein n=1 Tax=Spirosoma flavum TaxID=2048557 RepID=A0ABW6AGL8_9BACT
MAENLLDLAKSYLSDDVVSQVSTMLGEDQQNTQKAFDGALPAIFSGLVQKSAEPGGTSSIMDLIGEVMSPNRAAGEVITPIGGIPAHLTSLLADSTESSSLLSMGASISQSLFGDKTGAIATALASYSGVKQSSASSLLSLAGPILFSVLGKKLADDEIGISGLGGLLSGQKANSQSAVPSGFASLLGSIPGLSLFGGLGSNISDLPSPAATVPPITRVTTPPIPNDVPPVAPSRPTLAPVNTVNDVHSSDKGNRWLPWLLLALGVAALFYFMRSCRNDGQETARGTADSVSATVDNMATGVSVTADSAGSKVGAAMDSAGSAVSDATAKLGAFFKRKLPSGYELNIPENGIENNLVKFIEDKSRPVDKTTWFNFGRLLFDTGKATLKPNSIEEVKNIAEILKAFPGVDIKIGGYTDNTGSADINKKLSQERADAVMAELVKLDIAKSRLAAEGYGPEHPAATNDTEAGRAENRRIAVRVTKK